LLALLATAAPRPGSLLARALDTAESEVDAGIEQLRSLGIDVLATPEGFRLGLGGRLEPKTLGRGDHVDTERPQLLDAGGDPGLRNAERSRQKAPGTRLVRREQREQRAPQI
jgi:biotin operon repressor